MTDTEAQTKAPQEPEQSPSSASVRERENNPGMPASLHLSEDDIKAKLPIATAIGVVLSFISFLTLVVLMYWLTRDFEPGKAPPDAKSPLQKLQERRDEDKKSLSSYEFDPQKKTVRIPIDRAMELVAREYQRSHPTTEESKP